jgi:DNA-binding MarR family transcriptional regulator
MKIPNTGILIRQIQSNINRIIDAKVKAYDIGYGQFEYFIAICNAPGLSQQTLANTLQVSKVSVNKAITVLETAQLVTRVSDQTDKRAFNLYPTDLGKQAQLEIEAFRDALEAKLFLGLSPKKIEALNQTLECLNQNALSAYADFSDTPN